MRLRQNSAFPEMFYHHFSCLLVHSVLQFCSLCLTLSFIVNYCNLNFSNYSFVSKDFRIQNVKHCVMGRMVKMIYFIASLCLTRCSRVIYEWRCSGSFNIVPLMSQLYSSAGHICIISEW